jgi:hypothetical protein
MLSINDIEEYISELKELRKQKKDETSTFDLEDHSFDVNGQEIITPHQDTDSDKKFHEANHALVDLLTIKTAPLTLLLGTFPESSNKQDNLDEPITIDHIEYLSNKVIEWNNEINLIISLLNSFYASAYTETTYFFIRTLIKSCDNIAICINDAIKQHNEMNKDNKVFIIDYVKLLSKELSKKNKSNVSTMDELPK